MEIENTGYGTSFSEYGRSVNSSLFETDLPSLIEKMKNSNSWKRGEIISRVLLNSPDRQILLTALHENTEINSFQRSDSVTFRIVEGKIYFRTRKESAILDEGQVMTLHEHIDYSLITREETVLLLTLENDARLEVKT